MVPSQNPRRGEAQVNHVRAALLSLALFCPAFYSASASACAVCFGDPNSDMVKGAQAGVIVLAVFAYVVVMTMVGVAGLWAFRARRLSSQNQNQSQK